MRNIVNSRQYKPSHVRRLDTLSGNECAAPDCNRKFIARDGQTILSQICHIEAANPNGPRYNPSMTNDQRRHYNNLILLCDECHRLIDNIENVDKYPVNLLQEWKQQHETKNQRILISKGSMLSKAIDAIANIDLNYGDNFEEESTSVFNINEKIKYNNIVRNRHLIDDYKIYYTKISSIYTELEAAGSFKKYKLLRNINNIYLKVKGKYLVTDGYYLEELQKYSDDIIDDVEELLISTCSLENNLDKEDITFGVSIIMVDAFMRCKILEEPKNDS